MYLPKLVGPGAIVLALLSVACAANKAAASKCAPVPESFAMAGIVYRDCAVDRQAVPPARPPEVDVRPLARGRSGCSRVVIDVAIDTTGQPIQPTATIVSSNDAALAAAVVNILPRYRFQPARKNDAPVQQLVRIEQVIQFIVVLSPGGAPPSVAHAMAPRC